jgi:hypothetical protein
MKNLILFIYLPAFIILMSACSDSSNINDEGKNAKTEQIKAQNELDIELNEGQKWQVNEEMKPPLQRSEIALNKYEAESSEDYEILAQQLKSNNDELVKTCTMKGESHDQLHKWLHPHMKLTNSLITAENQKEADQIIEQLKSSFDTYHQYFQ